MAPPAVAASCLSSCLRKKYRRESRWGLGLRESGRAGEHDLRAAQVTAELGPALLRPRSCVHALRRGIGAVVVVVVVVVASAAAVAVAVAAAVVVRKQDRPQLDRHAEVYLPQSLTARVSATRLSSCRSSLSLRPLLPCRRYRAARGVWGVGCGALGVWKAPYVEVGGSAEGTHAAHDGMRRHGT